MKYTMMMITAVAGMALAASAFAQNATTKERELKGDPNKPLGGLATTNSNNDSHVSMMMSRQENDENITVKIENGDVTATRNGKPIPADKVRKTDNKIEILGDNGEILTTFNIGFTSTDKAEAPRAWRAFPGGRNFTTPPGVAIARQPKVMVGINMSSADGKLAEHLGLKDGGVVLDSVVEGLPASKAGLKANDVIVEIDGKRNVTEETIREGLKGKSPGDTVKVKYIRQGGNEQEATITLDAYDASKLGSAWPTNRTNPFGQAQGDDEKNTIVWSLPLDVGQVQIDQKKIRESLEQAMKELDDNKAKLDDMKIEVRKHLEQAMKELARSQQEIQDHAKELQDRMRIENLPRLRMMDNNRGLIVVPSDPVAPQPAVPANPQIEIQTKDKFDRILENLERLNKRLDDLEKRVGPSGGDKK